MIPVYVTGMGVISCLGNTVDEMFRALKNNECGAVSMPSWKEKKGLFTHVGAPAKAYDNRVIERSSRRTMSAMSEMATLATLQAVHQADLDLSESPERTVLSMGCSGGSPQEFENYFRKLIERRGPEGQLGTTFFKVMNHTVPTNVASALNFKGAVFSPSSACATSAQAMILGWELIQSGLYDVVIAGGADELHYTSAAVFDVVFAASRGFNDHPDQASRPFDKKRDGLVTSEGAGVVVLQNEKSLKSKRALARMDAGAYLCSGAHMSQSNSESMSAVMHLTLQRAGLKASEMQYVNAHATSTRQGDQEEVKAIHSVFGEVSVSSLKGHFGHSLAACGAIEAISVIKMLEEEVLIPTRNLFEIDPECSQVDHIKTLRNQKVKRVLSNNFAFGGINTSLILSRHEG